MNKKNIVISVLCSLLLIVIVSISYAYFSKIKKQDTPNVGASLSCLNVSISDHDVISLDNAIAIADVDGMKLTPYHFTLSNTCSTGVNLNINLEALTTNSLSADFVKVYFNKENPVLLSSLTSETPTIMGASSYSLLKNYYLPANQSKEYDLGLWIDASATVTEMNKNFDSKITYNYTAVKEPNSPSGWYDSSANTLLAKLAATTIVSKITPKAAATSTYTNTFVGAAPDDYGTSFYYHGQVDNNWVHFAGYYWRIIRINGDGSIRMIYSGNTAPTESESIYMTGDKTTIGQGTTNDYTISLASRAGYMYAAGDYHGYTNSSLIKITIDSWYESNLLSSANYISDAIYCNDRETENEASVYAYINNGYVLLNNRIVDDSTIALPTPSSGTELNIDYSPYRRLATENPSLKCEDNRDAFTVNDVVKGNGALTYPIALPSADELALNISFNSQAIARYHFLYNASNFFTMSPGYISGYVNDDGSVYEEFSHLSVNHIDKSGNLMLSGYYNNTMGIRPVISLKSNVNATGTGLYNDPYEINELS